MTARIVVVRAGALGDIVLSLPAVRHLRSRYPDARLHVVGYPTSWEVAGDLVDEIVSADRPAVAGLLTGVPSPGLPRWLEGTDVLIAWTLRDPTAALEGTDIQSLIHASPYPLPGVHAAAWLLRSVSPNADPLGPVQLQFRTDELRSADQTLAELSLDSPIILHPGAGATWKRWPAAQFAAVANALRGLGHQVAFIAGPADEEVIGAVQAESRRCFPVIRQPSVRRLGALLSRASLFIGNDSGVTHLAAVVGTPTIALFGPTDPANWRPLGTTVTLRHCTAETSYQGQIRVCEEVTCLASIPVDEVLAVS